MSGVSLGMTNYYVTVWLRWHELFLNFRVPVMLVKLGTSNFVCRLILRSTVASTISKGDVFTVTWCH